MRGKVAKNIRKLAGVKTGEKVTYHMIKSTERIRQLKDALGNVVPSFKTGTLKLDACPRVMYQAIKKFHTTGKFVG